MLAEHSSVADPFLRQGELKLGHYTSRPTGPPREDGFAFDAWQVQSSTGSVGGSSRLGYLRLFSVSRPSVWKADPSLRSG